MRHADSGPVTALLLEVEKQKFQNHVFKYRATYISNLSLNGRIKLEIRLLEGGVVWFWDRLYVYAITSVSISINIH